MIEKLLGYKGVLKQTLLIEIEKTRKKMIQVAMEEGITSDSTLQVSQSIDKLLNELHKVSVATK
ncbi:aspartyl-phosphate phosphatase Spo0E family protein [Priestia aryabhattai]|uniref:aspartyl-phosphate phosphatase Spo0E family protein n=1 Tax=Priestia aryabhattai TaxID=412384 RepID=UPI002E1E9831|nr:aspartyl-phosphate phosphatase Spo0E family protein [Priestia aryabhattai]